MEDPRTPNWGSHLPPHPHLLCDGCHQEKALVWYWLPEKQDALAFCGAHANLQEPALFSSGYHLLEDHREKHGGELRNRLLEKAPTVNEILLLESMRKDLFQS